MATRSMLFLGYVYFIQTAGQHGLDSLVDSGGSHSNTRPTCGGQHENSDSSFGKVLLIVQVLISRDKNFKALFLSLE